MLYDDDDDVKLPEMASFNVNVLGKETYTKFRVK